MRIWRAQRLKVTALIAIAITIALSFIVTFSSVPNPIYPDQSWVSVESVTVVHLDVLQYDEVLVLVRFYNPTHESYLISLERASLQAAFSGAFNRTVRATVESFRFSSSPPSPIIRLSPCSSAAAGLVFQGQLGLGNPSGPELTGRIGITVSITMNGVHRSFAQLVNWRFTWKPEMNAFGATNPQSGSVEGKDCWFPWLTMDL